MLTRRENMLRVFLGQEPEWVPVIALGDGYNRPAHMPGLFFLQLSGTDERIPSLVELL